MNHSDLVIALQEEIGDPALFTGREKELEFLMEWVDLVKRQLGDSKVLLARKRRGKTALIQRLYNILFTQNDPKVIPIYYRAPDVPVPYQHFVSEFFFAMVRQYLAFGLQRPDILRVRYSAEELCELASGDPLFVKQFQGTLAELDARSDHGWNVVREFCHDLAVLKDVRIIQIIDEFQYLSTNILLDGQPIDLCRGYQMTGSSKVSPQIVTGSYIGWLSTIVDRMVGRYQSMYLGPLAQDEALEEVYTYADHFGRQISPDAAAYMVEICHCDPYYISRMFKSDFPGRGPLTPDMIRKILDHETRLVGGEITKMWGDYILSAVERINDQNAKRIVLFLAKHDDREYTRKELLENLKLDISDNQLEKRMNKLVESDIVARGSSHFRYRGLGDPIFELVFRRIYGEEIDAIDSETLSEEFRKRFASLSGKLSNAKGLATEQKVRYYLLQAARKQVPLADLSLGPIDLPSQKLGWFAQIRKHSLHPEQNQRIEIDVYARAENDGDPDLAVEVKDHERPIGATIVDAFIEKKTRIASMLDRPPIFMMYSEHGFTKGQSKRLADHQILACDHKILAKLAE